ncbi:hypothetical protein ACIQGZ_16940 [Streptomyces sp. NPDC092296]|uniref:hypothetical protein n=1 Tax=Streptomyces sp. NPDC092296 TaxID=3366012 RepID=UPI0038275A56
MPEVRPGVFRAIFAKVERAAEDAARSGLIIVAESLVKQAKANASNGSHSWGTPTPATPGSGPARISGTLVASIVHTHVTPFAGGFEAKVGLTPGKTAPYGRRKTASSKYGSYLETGLRNGATYPFLLPATRMFHIQAEAAFRKTLSAAKWAL